MHPFQNGSHSDIMMMAASAGLLGGDHFSLNLEFDKNSDARFLSQSYEKIFDSNGKKTLKNVNMIVNENAHVEYKPYPAIPFANSDFENTTEVHLAKSATFSFIDIFSCGRTGMGEAFQMNCYRSRAKFYVEDKLVFADKDLIIDRSDFGKATPITGCCFFIRRTQITKALFKKRFVNLQKNSKDPSEYQLFPKEFLSEHSPCEAKPFGTFLKS